MINCQRAPSSEHQVSNSTLILCLTLGKSRFSVMQEKKKKNHSGINKPNFLEQCFTQEHKSFCVNPLLLPSSF